MASADFLDEMIADRNKVNPDFPRLLEAASRRRRFLERRTDEADSADDGG